MSNIEVKKMDLKLKEKQDAEETKEDLRTLYKILKDEHREGTLTIERGLKYISKLELEVASYKMIHEHDLAMIDEAKGNAVKWSKERDNFKIILDKVTDKLKETIKKERQLMPYLAHKSVSFHYANGREVLAKEILNIISINCNNNF